MEGKIGTESERNRPFYPNDNVQDLSSVDWKTRYNQLKNERNWDPVRDFVGIKRLGDTYHPLEPFFKFEGIPKEQIFFDRIWMPSFTGFIGLAAGFIGNWITRRPFWSSLPTTLLSGGVMLGVGEFGWQWSRKRARERDAVLIHYMLLHENEFPIIERKRFGQLTNPWIPFRVGNDGLLVEK